MVDAVSCDIVRRPFFLLFLEICIFKVDIDAKNLMTIFSRDPDFQAQLFHTEAKRNFFDLTGLLVNTHVSYQQAEYWSQLQFNTGSARTQATGQIRRFAGPAILFRGP